MLVISPWVGSAMAVSSAMSPTLLAPISMMAMRCSSVSRNRVRGTPMWLFRLPVVASVGRSALSTACTSSFVVVLPLLPVMAMNGMRNCRRWWVARSCRAFSTSGTTR